jgi:hypothetical protein
MDYSENYPDNAEPPIQAVRPNSMKHSAPFFAAIISLGAMAVAGSSAAAAAQPGHYKAGKSCSAKAGSASITLTDTSPEPVLRVRPGSIVVVTVPPWNWGLATKVSVGHAGVLAEKCAVSLPDRGRLTIFIAKRPGATGLGATVTPASDLLMPSWGGKIVVTKSAR